MSRKSLIFIITILATVMIVVYIKWLDLRAEQLKPALATVLEGENTDMYRKLAVNPIGNIVAIAERNGFLMIHDLITGKEITSFIAHQKSDRIAYLSFSKNGKMLASCGMETVKIWDSETWKLITIIKELGSEMDSVLFADNDKYLILTNRTGVLKVVEVATGKEVAAYQITGGYYMGMIGISPDRKFLARMNRGHAIEIIPLLSGKVVRSLEGHQEDIRSLYFSNDGKFFMSSDANKVAKIWDTGSWTEITTINEKKASHIYCAVELAMSNDDKILAISGENSVVLRQVGAWNEMVSIKPDSGAGSGSEMCFVKALFVENDKKLVVYDSQAVRVFEVGSWRELGSWKYDYGNNYSVSIAFIGRTGLLATGAENGRIKIWKISGLRDGSRGIWKQMAFFQAHEWRVLSLAASPDGRLLASGSMYEVKIWNTGDWKEVAVLKGHLDYVSLMFSDDGTMLTALGVDHEANYMITWATEKWQQKTLKKISFSTTSYRIALDNQGTVIAAITSSGFMTWSLKIWESGDLLGTSTLKRGFSWNLWGKRSCSEMAYTIAMSADGKQLSIGYLDGCIEIYDTENKAKVAVVIGDLRFVNAMAFSPQRDYIAVDGSSSGESDRIEIWKIK